MKLGKILGSISPAFGLLSGKGLFGSDMVQNMFGTMSPMYGMLAKKGMFDGDVDAGGGDLGINGLLASLFMKSLGH
jgi:hypothetical protein